ncbi:MAG TPA: M28 family peptidase [Gemmatimonadales bacterium]|nr:M28 family peptidase [Gemmatimonadales bacterium]
MPSAEPLPAELERILALAREAGSPGAAEARDILRDLLERLGYDVQVQRFAFSPRSLDAFPLAGAGLGWLALLQIPLLLMPALPPWAALLVWACGLAGLGAIAAGTALGWGGRTGSREDATLIARRGDAPVRRWIVAHTDTKAQGHSMAGRLVAVWVVLVTVAAFTVLAIARLGGVLEAWPVVVAAGGALAAGVLAGRGRLSGTTTGARDNGSGLVAALAAAEASQDSGTGLLFTGAEEFGLIGARILGETRRDLVRGTEVVNFDTLDERGALSLVSHDGRGRELAARLAPLLVSPRVPVRLRRLPLGIFVDSYPLARAGATAVTIGRLDWGTLRLLHTPRDTRDGLSFATARRIGKAIGSMTR